MYLYREGKTDNTTANFEKELIRDTFELPIQTRRYKIGVNVDDKSLKEETSISEVIGLNVSIYNLSIIDKLLANTKADVNLVINIEDDLAKNNTQNYIKQIDYYLQVYKQIKYISIGTSVNLTYRDSNKKYATFISEYSKIYDELKKNNPSTKIYTTFQYEALIGKDGGYYFDNEGQQMKFLDDLSSKLDIIGLNLLPAVSYENPDGIPINYFEPLLDYDKKIAIVQISWPARNLIDKEAKVYLVSSETIQANYLKKITQAIDRIDCNLLIWNKYKDDIDDFDIEDYGSYEVAIGLKGLDGHDREIVNLWKELKNVEYIPTSN
jgi:hypothetical protein